MLKLAPVFLLLAVVGCNEEKKEIRTIKYSSLVENNEFVNDLRENFKNSQEALNKDQEHLINIAFYDYLKSNRERALKVKGMWPGSVKNFLLKDPKFVQILNDRNIDRDSLKPYFYINEKFFETLN
jgi:hypothetical protein